RLLTAHDPAGGEHRVRDGLVHERDLAAASGQRRSVSERVVEGRVAEAAVHLDGFGDAVLHHRLDGGDVERVTERERRRDRALEARPGVARLEHAPVRVLDLQRRIENRRPGAPAARERGEVRERLQGRARRVAGGDVVVVALEVGVEIVAATDVDEYLARVRV